MKKINIQKDLDSRRDIARMAYPAKSGKENKVKPSSGIKDDKSKEDTRETADKIYPGGEEKKSIRRRTSAGNK